MTPTYYLVPFVDVLEMIEDEVGVDIGETTLTLSFPGQILPGTPDGRIAALEVEITLERWGSVVGFDPDQLHFEARVDGVRVAKAGTPSPGYQEHADTARYLAMWLATWKRPRRRAPQPR